MTLEERNKLAGRTVKAEVNGEVIEGTVCGRLMDAPVFLSNVLGKARFEISWELAKRAVEEGIVIKY